MPREGPDMTACDTSGPEDWLWATFWPSELLSCEILGGGGNSCLQKFPALSPDLWL